MDITGLSYWADRPTGWKYLAALITSKASTSGPHCQQASLISSRTRQVGKCFVGSLFLFENLIHNDGDVIALQQAGPFP